MPARTPQCALTTMQKLAWSYLDRAGAGDFSRSSVVIAKFAQAYPGVRAQLASATGVAALPPRIDEYFSELTAGVIGFVLSAAALDENGQVVNPALREHALQIRVQTAATVGTLFNTKIDPVVAGGANLRAFESLLTQHEPERLGTALDGAIAESFECAASSSFDELLTSLRDGGADVVARAQSAVASEEPFVIRARTGQAAFPRWAIWGLGAVAVGAAGWAIVKAAA